MTSTPKRHNDVWPKRRNDVRPIAPKDQNGNRAEGSPWDRDNITQRKAARLAPGRRQRSARAMGDGRGRL